MKKSYFKYIASLILFGSNGIVASYILLGSVEIVFTRTSIGSLPAQTVAICGYLEPLSALILSAVFLGETLSIAQVAGAMLILGGAGWVFRYSSAL